MNEQHGSEEPVVCLKADVRERPADVKIECTQGERLEATLCGMANFGTWMGGHLRATVWGRFMSFTFRTGPAASSSLSRYGCGVLYPHRTEIPATQVGRA